MTTPSANFPRKLFYKIHEVSEIAGVEAYVLRYWESKFPMLRPERYGNDERRFRQRDVELVLRIRQLLYDEKYTIAGAVERLKAESRRKGSTVAAAVQPATPEDGPLATKHLEEILAAGAAPENGLGGHTPDEVHAIRRLLAGQQADLLPTDVLEPALHAPSIADGHADVIRTRLRALRLELESLSRELAQAG